MMRPKRKGEISESATAPGEILVWMLIISIGFILVSAAIWAFEPVYAWLAKIYICQADPVSWKCVGEIIG